MLDKKYNLSKKELKHYFSLTNNEDKSWFVKMIVQKEELREKNKTLNFFEKMVYTYGPFSDKKEIRGIRILTILLPLIGVILYIIKN